MSSIKYYPYEKPDGSNRTSEIMPIYNGLRFVVDGDWTSRINHKYIAQIYDAEESELLATLKHNKELTTNYGAFDVGRILESRINNNKKSTSTYTTDYLSVKEQGGHYLEYEVKFGEEFGRTVNITTAVRVTLGSFYRYIITTSSTNRLRVGDGVTFLKDGGISYTAKVNGINSTTQFTFITNDPNVISDGSVTTDCVVVEGEYFDDNYYYLDTTTGVAYAAFIVPSTLPTRISEGDRVVIKQNNPTNFSYEGDAIVKKIYTDTIGVTSYQIIVTDNVWAGSTPAEPGVIYSKENYVLEDSISNTQTYKTFNGSIQYENYPSWDAVIYLNDEKNDPGKFLSNQPKTNTTPIQVVSGDDVPRMLELSNNDYHTLSAFRGSEAESVDWDKYQLYLYDESAVLLSAFTFDMTFDTQDKGIYDVGVGPKNLESILSGYPSTKYYVLNLSRDPAFYFDASEKLLVKIVDSCDRYKRYRIKYINHLGQWDYYTFTKRSNDTLNIERSNFRQRLNSTNSSGNYSYEVGRRGNTTYNVNAQRSVSVGSDWIGDHDKEYLLELFTSPEVYLIDEDNSYNEIPVIITNTELEVGKSENYGLFRYILNFEYANKILRQRN